MTKRITFKQQHTIAAMQLMNQMREQADLKDVLSESARDGNDDHEVDEWIILSWEMEAELLRANIEELQRQIEGQNFNV